MTHFKRNIIAIALCAGLTAFAHAPAQASASTDYFRARANANNIPEVLSRTEREYYRALFAAIDAEDWQKVYALLDQRGNGPLHQVAVAEFYLHENSPKVEAPQIEHWLAAGLDLPQAEQILALGQKRGIAMQVVLPKDQQFVSHPYASKRILPKNTADSTMSAQISSAIQERIKNDDPAGAHQILMGIEHQLSRAALAEWRQKVAWSYYIENQDRPALQLALQVGDGSGPWVAEGFWAAGLAAWRLGDMDTAANSFENAAINAANDELIAAARYWASRAFIRARKPEQAAEQLRGAAWLDETLYGMLAREQLGQRLERAHETPDFTLVDWRKLRDIPNVRVAVGLAEIGREDLADEVLRHQARIGNPEHYTALSRLAREMGVPSTQLWMAHNAPVGAEVEPALRFPAPHWAPVNGWKVDPALAFAHTLQESIFRPKVVSPAGARGLMQIMPAAAKDHAARLGVSGNANDLNRPEINLAFGQEHLNTLKSSPATGGLLPKVMAAYNAGLVPTARWNTEVRDLGDPLLYMESVPYWETRGYVAIVMRNYWMYERQAGGASDSRKALAEGKWPVFPVVR